MNSTSLSDTPAAKVAATNKKPIKVCMHVLRDACSDVRAIRAGTALVKAGFDVSMIDVQQDRSRPSKEDVQGMHMYHLLIPGWYSSRLSELWFFVIAIRTFILSIMRLLQSRADIYHATELTALPACCIVAALRHKPLVYESYELPIPYPITSITFWRKSAKLLRRLLAFVLPRCASVIATSPYHAQEMQKHFHIKKVCLLRNIPPYKAVQKSDRLRQYLGLGPETRIALYQGYIQPDRGLDRVVRAARFLEPDIVIVMMGKAVKETFSQLEALIALEGVADRVKIIPPAPYEELLDWTASADIGLSILPPDYSLSTRLCLPNKVFEYLMAGLPVLSSQLDAVSELINTCDVGQIVASLAPADVGTAINAMLADTLALARMRQHALDATQREFNWEKESQQLVHLYQEIGMLVRSMKVHV